MYMYNTHNLKTSVEFYSACMPYVKSCIRETPNLSTDADKSTHTVQCRAVQCSVVQCSAVQYSTVHCSPVHCSAVQCRAVQCSAV